MICDFDNISIDTMDLLVVCYGGCCSNAFVYILEKNGYTCKTELWEKILCHCPHYIDINIPIIYLYDNPVKSLISMKNRGEGIWDKNQRKMSNNMDIELSDETLLKLMIKQFHEWTDIKRNNVLVVRSSELFEESIVAKLNLFLNKKIEHFPMEYRIPRTNVNAMLDEDLIELFDKYKYDIEWINGFCPSR